MLLERLSTRLAQEAANSLTRLSQSLLLFPPETVLWWPRELVRRKRYVPRRTSKRLMVTPHQAHPREAHWAADSRISKQSPGEAPVQRRNILTRPHPRLLSSCGVKARKTWDGVFTQYAVEGARGEKGHDQPKFCHPSTPEDLPWSKKCSRITNTGEGLLVQLPQPTFLEENGAYWSLLDFITRREAMLPQLVSGGRMPCC